MEKEIISTLNSSSYIPAIVGGILISLATTVNLYGKGRSTGISNMLGDFIRMRNFYQNLIFILGMIWVSTFLKVFYAAKLDLFEKPVINTENLTVIGYIIAGFLLGLGSRLSAGDESEYMICGIPRLSKRSFTYTLFATIAAIGTASFNSYFGFTHKLNMGGGETSYFQMLKNRLNPQRLNPLNTDIDHALFSNFVQTPLFYATSALVIVLFLQNTYFRKKTYDFEVSLLSGILYGAGCVISGMTSREKVLHGLSFNLQFDPCLMIFFMTAIGSNFLIWNLVLNTTRKPMFSDAYNLVSDNRVDLKFIIGAALNGVAIGISGFCIGTSVASFTVYFPRIAFYLLSFFAGQFASDLVFDNKFRSEVQQTVESKVQ